ncbi:MAG: endonuclease MutS2 [Ignavibacteriales bacterium]|nr:endonuclease MutS2 [Ignavibacteriales bacterium]
MADFTNAIKKLEFDKVLDRIRQFAVSEPAQELAKSLHPFIDHQTIQHELRLVSEAKELLIVEGSVPLDGIKNIIPALKKSSIENHILTCRELLDIASTLRVARVLSAFIMKRRIQYPLLVALSGDLFYDKVVEYNILDCIDDDGNIRDSASKELKQIRQDMISVTDLLRKRLASILKRVSEKEIVQEEIMTTRDGRMVIPIKVEHKNHLPGFIHSSSASGATVFIEPAETLDLNNSLRELQLSEQREIARILDELTKQVREIKPQLEVAASLLAQLDLIFAKAKYSIEILGNPPGLTNEQTMKLVQARHPALLQRHRREEVIPLDLELREPVRTLLITGPNAGGKSVAMKSVGLLALCAQSGIHIPVSPESELCVFENIFVDIGDDQSIENDLSTFSSHLVRLKQILEDATSKSLVLIDEIGAGTDPAEGGALAAATLKQLTERGAITIATTHHGMLKAFAHGTHGISNASMEFDQKFLQPTYHFRMGVPGSSYALELANRLGLPQNVLTDAQELVGDKKLKLEQLLADLETQSQTYQKQIQEVTSERDRLQNLVRTYDQKMAELRKELNAIRRKAVDEAQEIVQGAHALIERSIKEIRESSAEKKTILTVRENVKKAEQEIAVSKPLDEPQENEGLAVGDAVRLKNGSEVGEIVEIRGDMANVLWGSAKLKVKLSDLKMERTRRSSETYSSPASTFSLEGKSEIDLRGLLGEEAVSTVQHFLDNAVVAGLHRVDIIHGKGTGALRKHIAEFLKTYPHIKSFRLGEWNEGGTGVTVVELSD